MGAMDQTIVATAGPTIISDLGGLSLYAWVFSAYILSQTVAMPVFGKLSDLFGRKRLFITGLAVFMIGSALSGASRNIDELIVFRALQGVGSGAFFPIAIAVVGVIFPPQRRGLAQGIFASIFGIAAVVGPSVGSYIVQAISWRWVFYVNLPLGIASLALITLGLRESRNNVAKPVLDWKGISLLAAWVALLILGFLNGGSTYPWLSWQEIVTFGASAILFVAFIQTERFAAEPVLPLKLFRNRVISSAATVSFLRGAAFFSMLSFVPLFVQAGLAGNIADGRNVLNALLIPMIVASVLTGQLATKIPYRWPVLVGLIATTISVYFVAVAGPDISLTTLMELLAIVGAGIGSTFTSVVLAIQYSAPRSQIGVSSSLSQFMGNLGQAIGLAIFGSYQVNSFKSGLVGLVSKIPPAYQSQAATFLGDPNLVGQVLSSPTVLAQLIQKYPTLQLLLPSLRNAFAQSIVNIFWLALAISAITVVASVFMSGSLRQQLSTWGKEETAVKPEVSVGSA
jgi:EmrB/QacA subfamily drug resistance transporter